MENKTQRYERQILLPEVGPEGQKKIEKASILLVGAGGLGSSCAYYLAAAGVGHIGLLDDDTVEESNLNRQILHSGKSIGKLKVISAQETLQRFNPNVLVEPYPCRLSAEFPFESEVDRYDLVVDCTDNYESRYRINELCVSRKKPWIFAAVFEFEGQVMTVLPGKSPCFRCLYPSARVQDRKPAVMGVVPGLIGILQAAEALKYILGSGSLLAGRLIHVDLKDMRFDMLRQFRNPNCPACSKLFSR